MTKSVPTLKKDRYFQDLGPICPTLGEDGSDSIDDKSGFIPDPSWDYCSIDERYLATNKYEVAESSTSGEGCRLGTEVFDLVVFSFRYLGACL